MFRVVLWDYTGESMNWAKNFLKDNVEIVRTIHPSDTDQAERLEFCSDFRKRSTGDF